MEERHNGAGRGSALRPAVRLEAANEPAILGVRLTPRGELYRSFGNGYTRAFELAVTPTLFGLLGYGVDRWLGIVPVLTTVLALVALLTLLGRTWIGYVEQMRALESTGPWAVKSRFTETAEGQP